VSGKAGGMRIGGVRIGAGRLGGRRLTVPAGARPSGGKLRAALFSIWGERLAGASLLDLFAGSGAIAVEAWSRGAATVTLVESDRRSLAAVRANVALIAAPGAARLLAEPALTALGRLVGEGARFDLIFADPPYADLPDDRLFAAAARVAAAGASLAVEHRAGVDLGELRGGWRRGAVRRYGDSGLSFYELAGD
jgi:16S rRNA (guanine(966)-N(2))-methyltransferase RsmD